jgi:diguanylate cyclase (GGDEF)-like protein
MGGFRRTARVGDGGGIADGVDRVFRQLIAMIALLALTLVAVFAYLIGSTRPDQERYRSAARALAIAHAAMVDEEAALRGYLFLRDPALLETYQEDVTTVTHQYAALDRLLGTDREMAPSLLRMRVAQQAWDSEWARAAISARGPGEDPYASTFYSRGTELFGAYRSAEVALGGRLDHRRDAIYAEQGRVLVLGLATTAMLGAFALLVAVRHRRRLKAALVEPVAAILSATEAIARLDLDVALEPSGPTEFRRIGEGITAMRDALSESLYHELAAQERIEAQANQLRTILAMSRDISGSLDLGSVLESVASAAMRVSGFPEVRVWLADDQTGRTLSCVYDSGAEHGIPQEELDAEMGVGVVGQAVRFGRMASADESGEPSVELHAERSVPALAVPLVVGARISGALELSSPAPRLLTADTVEVLKTLAGHAAAAIEAASLHTYTEELAHTDALTGLANRRLLDQDLALECERAARYGRPLALVMFDVDHFKQLNDTYGHARGDEVLRQLAEVVGDAVRTTDTVYRYGGEEFAVLVREAGHDDAHQLAERLRALVEEHFAGAGSFKPVTASFGIALVPPSLPIPAEVVAAADAALYRSKSQGRNRVSGPIEVGPVELLSGDRPIA